MPHDDLKIYATGAAYEGGPQRDPDLSVGGYRSCFEASGLGIRRSGMCHGVFIEHASEANGVGFGMLEAVTTGSLKWTPPGDDAGDTVDIAYGETKVIAGDDPDKFVRVTRTTANSIYGIDNVNLTEQFNNVIGFADAADAERQTGVVDYRSVFFRNESALSITNLSIWPDVSGVRVGLREWPIVDTDAISVVGAGGSGASGVCRFKFACVMADGALGPHGDAVSSPLMSNEGVYIRGIPYQGALVTSVRIYVVGMNGTSDPGTNYVVLTDVANTETSPGSGVLADYLYLGILLGVPGDHSPMPENAVFDEQDLGTSPSASVSWSTGTTKADGVSLATLSAGTQAGVWLERTIAAGASATPDSRIAISYEFTLDGETFTGSLFGHHRIEDDSLVGYGVFDGIDAMPDFTVAPSWASATLPILTDALSVSHDHYIVVRARNKYGLWSQNEEPEIIRVAADKSLLAPRPTVQDSSSLSNAATGKLSFSAFYNALQDGDNRADTWLVWHWCDGDTPLDPDVDAPTLTKAMLADKLETLALESDAAYPDGYPARAIIRTGLAEDGGGYASSSNTTVLEHEVSISPSSRPYAHAFFSRARNQRRNKQTAPSNSITYYDDDDISKTVCNEGSTEFWIGDLLVWRAVYDTLAADSCALYIPSEWSISQIPDWTGAGSAYPIEIVQWDESIKEAYVAAYGNLRCLKIDGINMELYFGLDQSSVPTAYGFSTPITSRYNSVVFQVYDCANEWWTTFASVNASGVLSTALPINQTLTQSEVIAL